MSHSEFWLDGAQGVRLYGQIWLPSKHPTSFVGIVHGFGEHSGRYGKLTQGMLANDVGVAAFDLRGHGRSGGPRGHVRSWNEYLIDLGEFVRTIGSRFPDSPIFLFGHSLGSLIVADYALSKPEGLSGVVLSSLGIEPAGAAGPVLVAVAKLLSGVAPRFRAPLSIDSRALSRDLEEVKSYEADPLVHHVGTARWGTESLKAIKKLKTSERRLALPVLMIHGGADRINLIKAAREFFSRTAAEGSEFREYVDSYHEAHNDLDHQKVIDDLADWLKRHGDRSQASPDVQPRLIALARRFDTERHPSGWTAETIPLAHGERELTRFTVRDFVASGAIRFVQFDSMRA